MTGTKTNEASAATRMDVLVLGCLARRPMHGWQVKAELAYKHVDLYARCDHGHLYWTLKNLEKKGLATSSEEREGNRPTRKVLAITAAGRAHLAEALRTFGGDADDGFSDLDLFLANAWVLPKDEVIDILERRLASVQAQLAIIRDAADRMKGKVPLSGELIIDHRARFLEVERRFVGDAIERVRAARTWGSYFGDKPIEEVAEERGVDVGMPAGKKGRGQR